MLINLVYFSCLVGYALSVTTPDVFIYEENPSSTSDRVRRESNGAVTIWALNGQTVVMECRTINNPPEAKVYWLWAPNLSSNLGAVTLNNGLQSEDPSKYKIGRGKQADSIRLEISTIAMGKVVGGAGIYTCQSSFSGNSNPIKAIRTIEVYQMPSIVLYDSSYETDATENDKVQLKCTASGWPTPEIYWKKISGSSRIITGYGTEARGNKIDFSSVRSSDRGLYVCNALNKIGSVKWEVKLNVKFKPIVSNVQSNGIGGIVNQKIGCNAEIRFKVEGYPLPDSISVANSNGQTLQNTDRIKVYQLTAADSTVYVSVNFQPFMASDIGNYKCVASNTFGSGDSTISLQQSSVILPDRLGQLTCSSTSYKPTFWIFSFFVVSLLIF